jgi:hypothetical protein
LIHKKQHSIERMAPLGSLGLSWALLGLRTTYGDRVEDCFAGTEMQTSAEILGAGLWLVRGAAGADQLKTWNAQLHESAIWRFKNLALLVRFYNMSSRARRCLEPACRLSMRVCRELPFSIHSRSGAPITLRRLFSTACSLEVGAPLISAHHGSPSPRERPSVG